MSTTELNTEPGDTLIITVDESVPHHTIRNIQHDLHSQFKGQELTIIVIHSNINITLIKSSNLKDNTDIDLRENNPALQDAWEQYQIVKNLSVTDNGT